MPVAAPAILSFSMCVLCVFIDLLRSPSLRRDGVDCACGCARYIVFIVFGVDCAIVPVAAPAILSFSMCVSLCVFYVCTMCLPQREHVLFGVVKWKLDVQLYWLDTLHSRHFATLQRQNIVLRVWDARHSLRHSL